MERTSFTIVLAAGWSRLLTAITSGISMIPALSAWIESPEPGMSTSSDRVGDPDHLDLALARADRLEEEELLAGGVEHEGRLQGRLREPAEVPARAHRADEDLRVEEVVGEADAVAEKGTLREGARRVDGDNADARPLPPHEADESADQARLAHAGRAGDADGVGVAGLRVELPDQLVGERVAVLDQSDRPCERTPVAGADARHELL